MSDAISYQSAYLWECPCGAIWQARHRPRGGTQLVCAVMPEQRLARPNPGTANGYAATCGSIHTSAGRRKGIAPNVTV